MNLSASGSGSQLPEPSAVRELAESALVLPGVRAERGRVQRLLEDYARGVETQRHALVVALVGATGAGKSTLLNALVGAPVARSGEQRPTTAHAVVYAPADAILGELAGHAGAHSGSGTKVVTYPTGAPGPWSGQIFVDTPDLNSVERIHRDRAEAVLDQADVALVVLHKGSVAEAVQTEFLARFAQRRRLIFVLNHSDLLSAASREELKAQVLRIARERLGVGDVPVYAVSALQWLVGGTEVGERDELLAALRALGDKATSERIRRSNAVGALRELQSLVRPAVDAAEASAQKRAALLDEGLTRARVTLADDFALRLGAASAHLGHAVRREAARRFWGPAGWWMRMSLAGTSGLGAAALLVRGNPLVAGGVALGSAVLSRVQEATLQHSAERRIQGEALVDDVAVSAAQAGTVSARAAAGAEGLNAKDAGIPPVELVAESFARARAAVWEATSTLGLAEAVRRWWRIARYILLPLVNLPLLALFVHVGYRVVRGYIEGQYVGSDFLLNAAALAGVIAAIGAGIASLSLAGVRRRLVSDGRRQFERATADLSAQWVAQTKESDAPSRESARQLLGLLSDV